MMRLLKVDLLNWASYKGLHTFDFSSTKNRNGYAIFGNNSRGKTSFTDAIKWVMYGEAFTKAVMGTDGKESRKRRPLVSAQQEDNPLLNVHSFREGVYDLMVRIIFSHEGTVWTLARVVAPDTPIVGDDNDLGFYLGLSSETERLENQNAQDFINNLLPKDINKFFFIDGESVNEYRALIANTEQNLEIRKNIEDILNFPILKRGAADLKEVTGQYMTKLSKLSKDTNKNRIRREKIDKLEGEIAQAKSYMTESQKELKKAEKEHDTIESKLGLYKETEKLIERQRGNRKLISAANKSQNDTYTLLKKENKDLWLYFLQPSLKQKISLLAPELEQLSEIRYSISQLNQRSRFLLNAHQGEKTPCSTCHRLPEPRDKEQKKLEVVELDDIAIKIQQLNESLDDHKQSSELYNSLQQFNTANRLDTAEHYQERLGELQGEIELLNEEQSEIKDMLDGLDDKEIEVLKNKLEEIHAIILNKRGLTRRLENQIELLTKEMSDNRRALIGSDGSDESTQLRTKIKALEAMSRLWDIVSDKYAQETRVVIEEKATETFKSLTNNPDGYEKLELNSGFGLKIIDSDGYVIPAPSPGAQQVVAISLIDALRQTSDIDFPIIFDTPGASIDKEHRDNIIRHFWSKRDTQFIILASSGEFRPDEVEKDNKELLAKTWQLDFNSGVNSTIVTPRLQ
jgi:DNA sulfur modification protein DndD